MDAFLILAGKVVVVTSLVVWLVVFGVTGFAISQVGVTPSLIWAFGWLVFSGVFFSLAWLWIVSA